MFPGRGASSREHDRVVVVDRGTRPGGAPGRAGGGRSWRCGDLITRYCGLLISELVDPSADSNTSRWCVHPSMCACLSACKKYYEQGMHVPPTSSVPSIRIPYDSGIMLVTRATFHAPDHIGVTMEKFELLLGASDLELHCTSL